MANLPFPFRRSWPSASPSHASPTYTPHSQRTVHRPRRILGLSPQTVTAILSGVVFWNAVMLILCVTVSAVQGRRPYDPAWQIWYNRIKEGKRVRMVFLWCTIPFVLLIVSIFDLVRRNTLTVRRAAISTGVGATFNVLAFLLWGDCSYFSPYEQGLYPVCYHDPGATTDAVEIIFVLPWFALGAAITYTTLLIMAILALRRQRKAAITTTTELAHHKSPSAVEMGKASSEYSELGPSSIGEETLPSRPMSVALSRELSVLNYSRPPNYPGDSGDNSLLTVPEKEGGDRKGESSREDGEGRGSVGYA